MRRLDGRGGLGRGRRDAVTGALPSPSTASGGVPRRATAGLPAKTGTANPPAKPASTAETVSPKDSAASPKAFDPPPKTPRIYFNLVFDT